MYASQPSEVADAVNYTAKQMLSRHRFFSLRNTPVDVTQKDQRSHLGGDEVPHGAKEFIIYFEN